METLGLIYLAVGPGIALAVYLYYADKWEPEPKSLVVLSFVLGGLACFPSSYVEIQFEAFFNLGYIWGKDSQQFWPAKIFYAFAGVALVEEACKFLFLKGFIYDRREFSEPFDGIVYGGILGCGFATVENLIYVLPLGPEVGILRVLTAVPGHVFDGVILGYFMGRARFSPLPERELWKGLGLVIGLHGLYDSAVFIGGKWAFVLIFGIVVLGLYLALKAKKELEQHSEVIEFSSRKYRLAKTGRKEKILTLKGIRNLLSKGRLLPDDTLTVVNTGKTKTVRDIFSAGVVSQYAGLVKVPARAQSVTSFLIWYVVTFGFYFFFWFLRNYRDLRNYKRIQVNPEFKTLALFVIAVIPYYLYGMVFEPPEGDPVEPLVRHIFHLGLAGVQAGFLFLQLRLLKRFMKRKLKGTFRVEWIAAAFFLMNGLGRMLSPGFPFYLILLVLVTACEGLVLSHVQKDLNDYWILERSGGED